MAVSIDKLPNDVEILKSIIIRFEREIQSITVENAKITAEKERYKYLYEDARRRMFARKSERLQLEAPEQARLFNEAEVLASPGIEGNEPIVQNTPEKKRQKRNSQRRKPKRTSIPPELPRKEIRHDVSDEEKICPCCENPKEVIREDITEELQVIPEQVIVLKNISPIYACPKCKEDSVIAAPQRHRLLPGTIAAPGLLAYIIQRKYQFGLPLYRLSAIFDAIKVEISRQTMSNWIVFAAEKLKALYDALREEIITAEILGLDETTIQVLHEKGRKSSDISYIWHTRGSPRAGPLSLFEYQPSRSTKFLFERFTGYNGTILTDGYGSYDVLAREKQIKHAGCWAHVRREFFRAYQKSKDEQSMQFLLLIRKLFKLENAYQNLKTSSKRSYWRRRFSAPIISAIKKELDRLSAITRPTSDLGKAIQYTLGQWSKLILFLDNSQLPIHNNDVERGIRPFVIGRKNWLFANTANGAYASALFYSLVESAKVNNHNPYDYFLYLFEKFPACTSTTEIKALLPNRVTAQELSAFLQQYAQI